MGKSNIPSKVLAELNRQANHELAAAYGYQAMATWCDNANLPGCAEFLNKQAGEEREHAQKIIDHLVARGTVPEFAALPAPKQDFKSLLAVALQAQEMEQANTRGINAVFEAALAAKDYPAQVLMHWFINEQVEEEAWAAELVARVQAANCAGGLSSLDRHIVKQLTSGEDDKD